MIPATASNEQLIALWNATDLSILADLPTRLDDATLAKIETIARLPVPTLPPSDERHFMKCMRSMRLLPQRADDELKGELRLAIYRRHFGGYCREALSFLTEQATLTCRFFPTPAECQAILDRWQRKDPHSQAHHLAMLRSSRERQTRFDEIMARLRAGTMSQAEVDGLSEHTKLIAETRGYLRIIDGEFIVRTEPASGETP